MVIKMNTINRIFSITHMASIVACVYLGVYSIQQMIETNELLFSISLTDGLIVSIFCLHSYLSEIYSKYCKFLEFLDLSTSFFRIRSGRDLGLFLFSKSFNLFLILFGIISLFQIVVSIWLLFRYMTFMKIGE